MTRLPPALARAAGLMQDGRIDEAEAICRDQVKRNRRDADALHLLGMILTGRGRLDEAARCYRRGLRAAPTSVPLLCGLGEVCVLRGLPDEALEHYDRALAADPDHSAARAGKANALERGGDLDAARAVLEPLVAAGREDAEAAVVYATLARRAGEPAAARALLERHLARPSLADVTAGKLLYALGWSCEDMADEDAAFDAFRRANERVRSPYDVERDRARIDRIIETFDRERAAARPRSTNDSELPVFIVSMPRSGSTLVERILAAHPRVFGAGEIEELTGIVHGLPRELSSSAAYPEIVLRLTRRDVDRLGRRYVGRIKTLDATAERITDKNLRNFLLLGLADLLLPRARVIAVWRDPLDTCLSCYMHPLSTAALPYTTDLGHLGGYYHRYERLMRHWSDACSLRRLDVRYEELVANPEPVTRAIVAFCGLDWSDECLRFHESDRATATMSYDQVRRPIYTTAVRRYERYEAHLAPLREALMQGP